MLAIEIAAPDGARRVFPLQRDRTTIGRAGENDIFLPDRWLSRRHAEIRQTEGDYYLVDLDSKNGTIVNRVPIREPLRLHAGDVITLGDHALTFSAETSHPEDPETEPVGTQIFSARELSRDIRMPSGDAEILTRQNRVLRVLSDAAAALIEHRPLAETFERVLDLLLEAVVAERAAIVLTDLSGELEIKAQRVRVGTPIDRISRSIAKRGLQA